MIRKLPALILLSAFTAIPALAQPERPPGQQRGWERIEQLRKVRLIELLDLKEDQSARFFARLREQEEMRRDLMKQKDEALDKIERLIRNHADTSEYQPVFEEVHGIEMKMDAGRKKFFDGLSDILSIDQRGKLLIFERRFDRELRDAFRETQRRRHQGEN